jgi:hypothetical protein
MRSFQFDSFCFQNINIRPNIAISERATLWRLTHKLYHGMPEVIVQRLRMSRLIYPVNGTQNLLKRRPWITVRFNSRDTRRLQRKRISGCKAEILYRRCVAEMDQCPREWIAESLVCSSPLIGRDICVIDRWRVNFKTQRATASNGGGDSLNSGNREIRNRWLHYTRAERVTEEEKCVLQRV